MFCCAAHEPPAARISRAGRLASGPTVRHSAMPEMFESLMYSARHELVITTPYYVPNDALQGALCAAGNRGRGATIVSRPAMTTLRWEPPAGATTRTCSRIRETFEFAHKGGMNFLTEFGEAARNDLTARATAVR